MQLAEREEEVSRLENDLVKSAQLDETKKTPSPINASAQEAADKAETLPLRDKLSEDSKVVR